jgi:hypothetical protein
MSQFVGVSDRILACVCAMYVRYVLTLLLDKCNILFVIQPSFVIV